MKRFLTCLLGILLGLCTLVSVGCEAVQVFYKITVSDVENGTVTVDKTTAEEGESVHITATPNSGYYLERLTVNGASARATFTMPASDVTIGAAFRENTNGATVYNVLVDHSQGGTVSTDLLAATVGTVVTVTTKAEEGYALHRLTVNGVELEGTTFVMGEADAVVYAEFVKDGTVYAVTAQNDRYGSVTVDRKESRAGGTLIADYIPMSGYVLDYFTINGENVGTSNILTMPAKDAVISAVFKRAIEDTSVKVSAAMLNDTATSYWYFAYTDTGLDITVKVDDPLLIVTGEARYRDYVEIIIHNKDAGNTWVRDNTFKLTVTADGTCFMRTALNATAFGTEDFDFDSSLWSATAEYKQTVNKQGYSGYEVKMHVSYALLGLTAQNGRGKFAVCPAMNNSESVVSGNWESYAGSEWFDASTFLVIAADGSAA